MRWTWLAERLPDVLAVVAETAWLGIAYLGLQHVAAPREDVLGPLTFGAAVALGLLLGRRLPALTTRPVTRLGGFAALALVGVLAPPVARAELTHMPGNVLLAHPGGLLLGLAAVRGLAYASGGEGAILMLLRWGTLALALPWAAITARAGGVADGASEREVAAAFALTLVFLVGGLLALAAIRLRAAGEELGFDWRAPRAWWAITLVVVSGVMLIALPGGAFLRVSGSAILGAVLTPLEAVLAAPVALVIGVATVILAALGALIPPLPEPAAAPPAGQPPPPLPSASPNPAETAAAEVAADVTGLVVVLALAAAVVIAIAVLVLLLSHSRRRAETLPQEVHDQRSTAWPLGLPSLRPWFGRGRGAHVPVSATPRDAPSAYLRLLHDFEGVEVLRRAADETPAAHARRLRAEGRGALGLELLVADYELARFGGRDLPVREHRRAVRRWRRLRPRGRRRGTRGA